MKYVFDDEVRDYLARGQVVVFYHHRPRKKPEVHFPEITARIETLAEGLNPQIRCLTFSKRSVRDYFIVCPGGVHEDQAAAAVSSMLKSPWGQMTNIVWKQQG